MTKTKKDVAKEDTVESAKIIKNITFSVYDLPIGLIITGPEGFRQQYILGFKNNSELTLING